MSKKTAIFKDANTNAKITLIQNDDNTIDFEIDNAKGLMRLISERIGFEYNTDWNTQYFGWSLIKKLTNDASDKQATFKDPKDNETNASLDIIRNDDGSIRFEVNNAKGLMRLISNCIGFQYQDDWNTQYFGHSLINFINNPTAQA